MTYQQEIHARDHSDSNLETLAPKAKQEWLSHDVDGLRGRTFETLVRIEDLKLPDGSLNLKYDTGTAKVWVIFCK